MRRKANLSPKTPRVPEKVIEDQIIEVLTRIGYTVWKTGKDRSSLAGRLMAAVRPFLRPGMETPVFKSISGVLRAWSGNDVGLPDLIIRHRSWREHELMGIEVKGEGTVVSLEQSLLSQEGAYPICYRLDDVVRELKKREVSGGSPTQESTLKSLDNILTR